MIDIEPYRYIARAIAKKYFLPGYERQDVEQEAMIALWLAARAYRPELAPGGFERWAAFCIKRKLHSRVKMANRMKHGPLNTAISDYYSSRETVPGPEEIFESKEHALELLRRVREDLTPLERRCLIGIANGLSHKEIHEEVGGSESFNNEGRKRYRRVDNALKRASAKLAA